MMKERLFQGKAPSGLPEDFKIKTIERSFQRITIEYWEETQSFNVPLLILIGFIVGIAASALGVGGGFILVPIMVTFYGLPLYVLVAATIPYVITLSLTGLFSYTVTLPLMTGISTPPDWNFGLFRDGQSWEHGWLPRPKNSSRRVPETDAGYGHRTCGRALRH